ADANNTKDTGNTHELFFFDGKKIESQGEAAVGEKKKIAQNGIYQTRTKNSDNTWSCQVMYMGKMDASLPQVNLGFDATNGQLSWSAYKPVTAATAISHADINGYTVSSTPGKNLNGVLPIECGGTYTLTVQDEGGNSATISNTVSARPIRLDADTCSFIPTAAWNQAKNNGSLAVNLTGITGGTYNEADSTKATNTYHARYQLTLVPGNYDLTKLGTDKTLVWTTIKQGSLFTHDYPNLAVGEYKVVVRDEADKTVYSSVSVTVADSAMTASGATINASLPTAKDGQLMASAKGGNTKGFEFSIVPMKKVDETKQYTIAEFKTAAGNAPKWSLGDNISLSARSNTFTGLEKGWYLAAVRGLYGVTDSDFAALLALRETLATAEHALASALTPTAEELKALQKAVTDAQAAYDAAAKPLQDQSAAAYTGTPGYWDGAIVIALEVDADPAPVSGEPAPKKSNLGKLSSDGNGSAVYTLKSASGKLSPSDNKALLAANQENDLVLQGNGLSVFIPKGTLTKGFDVNRLIIDPTTAKSGKILQYTDESGQKTLIPWCLVSDGALKYMVSGLGDYALVDCAAPFADIAGLWGADAIAFMADRGILTGTGKNLFSPYLPMNRAMFVTALWRTAGKPAPKGQPSFSDLDGDWYRAAVQWAVESGITKGCGNNLFGSNLEVSREQMCAFLCRFLTYMGMELDLAPEDPTFKDAENISTWAKDAVAQCAKAGLVQGVGHDAFAPTNSASRMEVSTLLPRFITALVEKYCGK
ncbi:MAG: S-layer homology domain-containing protein, partial [Pseudoflavonifractor sp.]